MEKKKILFLCTGNSCRSQMAEGWTRHLKGDSLEVWSAGIDPERLNPHMVEVMAESGVDVSGYRSKHLEGLMNIDFDYVVTVCGFADENCPAFPGKTKIVHVGFDDPSRLDIGEKTGQDPLFHYRRVRDEIKAFIEKLPEVLSQNQEKRT